MKSRKEVRKETKTKGIGEKAEPLYLCAEDPVAGVPEAREDISFLV